MNELETLQAILNRLDLIYTALLFVVGIGLGGGVVYLLYRAFSYFL